jgi:hypothetical protein
MSPPIFNALDDAAAVGRNLFSGCIGSFFRRYVSELHPVFYPVDSGLGESLANPKDMMAQQSDGAISVIDSPLV